MTRRRRRAPRPGSPRARRRARARAPRIGRPSGAPRRRPTGGPPRPRAARPRPRARASATAARSAASSASAASAASRRRAELGRFALHGLELGPGGRGVGDERLDDALVGGGGELPLEPALLLGDERGEAAGALTEGADPDERVVQLVVAEARDRLLALHHRHVELAGAGRGSPGRAVPKPVPCSRSRSSRAWRPASSWPARCRRIARTSSTRPS